MNTARILQLIRHPELLDRETLYELRNLLSRYPYFTAVRILFLHNLYLLRDPLFNDELKLAALHVSNRKRLFQVIEGHKYGPALKPAIPFAQPTETASIASEPSVKPARKSRTLSLIEQFLSQHPEKEPLVSFDLTTDYNTYLLEENAEEKEEKEEDTPKSVSGTDLIDTFLNQYPTEDSVLSTETQPDTPEEESHAPQSILASDPSGTAEDSGTESNMDASFFTETLAKIYIKQGRYEKAIEIYKNIYLKNPKKSAYFADQIRFLEKLIINEK